MIEDLIDNNSIIYYTYLVIEKVAIEKMINLYTVVFIVKKSVNLILEVGKFDRNNI